MPNQIMVIVPYWEAGIRQHIDQSQIQKRITRPAIERIIAILFR
jgi:hypothetical protein